MPQASKVRNALLLGSFTALDSHSELVLSPLLIARNRFNSNEIACHLRKPPHGQMTRCPKATPLLAPPQAMKQHADIGKIIREKHPVQANSVPLQEIGSQLEYSNSKRLGLASAAA
jgi:hypothetical protein